MSGGRSKADRAKVALRLISYAWLGFVATACGQAFTTAPTGPDDATVVEAGWCATQDAGHTFCEDFFSGVPDRMSAFIQGGGMVAADKTDYQSAPQSMAASIPMLPVGMLSPAAIATKDFSSTPGTRFELRTYLRLADSCFENGGQSGISVISLVFPPVNNNYQLSLVVTPSEIDLLEMMGTAILGSPHQFKTTMRHGSWEVWTFSVGGGATLGALGKTVDVTIGSVPIFSKEPLSKAPLAALQHPTLELGPTTVGQSAGCTVGVDDILFDIHQL